MRDVLRYSDEKLARESLANKIRKILSTGYEYNETWIPPHSILKIEVSKESTLEKI